MKNEVRQFLDRQVEEKIAYRQTEHSVDNQQAEIWKQDRNDFFDSEQKKNSYIKGFKVQHQAMLLNQIKKKQESIVKGKMSLEELKQNKDRIHKVVTDYSADKTNGFKKIIETDLRRPL